MKLTRRNFVQALGTSMAVAVSGAGATNAFILAKSEGNACDASAGFFAMGADELKNRIGERFVATSLNGRQVTLTLAEVNKVGRTANSKQGYSGDCFSVVFRGRGDEGLAQGVYEMKSAKIDRFSALLVPTSRRNREFEMVVNRLTR